jgi:hypothetical protein
MSAEAAFDDAPIVIRKSRWKMAATATGFAVMMSVAPIALLRTDALAGVGVAFLIVASIMSLAMLLRLIRPLPLEVDAVGMSVGRMKIGWREVGDFRVVGFGPLKLIYWSYRISPGMAAGGLPDEYEMAIEDLVGLFNARAAGASSSASRTGPSHNPPSSSPWGR